VALENSAVMYEEILCPTTQYYNGSACIVCSSPDSNKRKCGICVGVNRLVNCSCPEGYFDAYVAGNAATFDCIQCLNPLCKTCLADL
jgi:hypothetical protein